ncbi:anti-sigma factor, partial [Mesorhizobium sp. M4A.F.Ca.ET.029.04.2.1]
MTLAEENGPERGGDDLFAAEYVLGVLAADERQIASRRIEADAAFARLVDRWEVHLSPMAAAYPETEPPIRVKEAIDRRLFAQESRAGLWSSLTFWRGLAAAAVAALAIAIALPYINPPVVEPRQRLVASLAADGSD